MANQIIANETDLGHAIAKLARQLKFVDHHVVGAYQYVRIDNKPFKISVQQVDEDQYNDHG